MCGYECVRLPMASLARPDTFVVVASHAKMGSFRDWTKSLVL